jgi:hypothetical protein
MGRVSISINPLAYVLRRSLPPGRREGYLKQGPIMETQQSKKSKNSLAWSIFSFLEIAKIDLLMTLRKLLTFIIFSSFVVLALFSSWLICIYTLSIYLLHIGLYWFNVFFIVLAVNLIILAACGLGAYVILKRINFFYTAFAFAKIKKLFRG